MTTKQSQTLWDQLNALAKWLAPAHEALHRHVLAQPVIGADETFWRLMEKGGDNKRWQTWAIIAPDAVSYRVYDSRSAEAAGKVLKNYSGIVLCDGYSAYASLRKRGGTFQLAHCWAHVRRKFIEAEEVSPKPCAEGGSFCEGGAARGRAAGALSGASSCTNMEADGLHSD